MAHLQRAVATLRVIGVDLVPENVSAMLGCRPTKAERAGENVPTKSPGRSRVAKTGQWTLFATDTEPENLDAQVSELLGQLTQDLDVWRQLSQSFRVDLFCGWFMGGSNEGVVVSPQTLVALGERGIELGLDIYGPEGA